MAEQEGPQCACTTALAGYPDDATGIWRFEAGDALVGFIGDGTSVKACPIKSVRSRQKLTAARITGLPAYQMPGLCGSGWRKGMRSAVEASRIQRDGGGYNGLPPFSGPLHGTALRGSEFHFAALNADHDLGSRAPAESG